MKLLFLIVIALVISGCVYFFTSQRFSKSKKDKKFNWRSGSIASAVFVCLLVIIVYGAYSSEHQPDMQCRSIHTSTSQPPESLITANDYYSQGNYDYDIGNCTKAVNDYTKALLINPNFSQAYNNRAYTNMRLGNYQAALPDLDKAIALNPKYFQALMNRGDIHNFYYQIDRKSAIADYERVAAIAGPSRSKTSVCGHLLLAKDNGWTLRAYLDFFTGAFARCG